MRLAYESRDASIDDVQKFTRAASTCNAASTVLDPSNETG
jgi:hypothetical protein